MARRKYQKKRQNRLIGRLFRSLLAVVILTAFVLFVSFSVKTLATMDAKRIAKLARPVLARLNLDIDEDQVGEVAGEFVERIAKTGKAGDVVADSDEDSSSSRKDDAIDETGDAAEEDVAAEEGVLHTIAFMADTGDDFDNLGSALGIAGSNGADVVFFLGDLTSYGDKPMLQEGKEVLDNSGLEYYIIPGDHDLAASEPAGPSNFVDVFGTRHQSVRVGDYKFLMFDNSANFTPLEDSDMDWFVREVDDADFVLLAQPLYHPLSDIVMGLVEGQTIADVRAQAEELLRLIRGFDVKAVVAADQHMFSVHPDGEMPEMQHFVVGALADQGLLEKNPLGPHMAIMKIFEDGTFEVEDIAL
jgi:predicted phosphodiesterase